jgi:hypothetical protein
MLKSCLHDLYIYMDKSITNAKLVESNKFTVGSYLPIPLILLVASALAIIVSVISLI